MSGPLQVLFPPACVACERILDGAAVFCGECEPLIELLSEPRCRTCAEPGVFPSSTCPRCRERAMPLSSAFAAYAHEGPIARAIHRFKYEDHPELAAPLAQLLANAVAEKIDRAAALCPIPLHPSRLTERAYDQAALLARAFARRTGHALVDGLLRRTKKTERQVGLSEEAREANVRDAFDASAAAKGRSVVLIDDVLTTGATARAAASALKNAGASSVAVVTLARAFS